MAEIRPANLSAHSDRRVHAGLGVGRRSSGAAQVHSNRRIFGTSLGDPTVPASFTRQLPCNQEFAMDGMVLLATVLLQRYLGRAGPGCNVGCDKAWCKA
jgi:hypothetical protein